MASTTHRLLLSLSILVGVLTIAGNARPSLHFHPCKTIFFISASSHPLDGNPNFSFRNPSSNGGRSFTFFFSVPELNPRPSLRSHNAIFTDRIDADVPKRHTPFDFRSPAGISIRDRTMDIMSVVGALLFGFGCGALTAGTMYLIWSLFSPNRFDYGNSDGEDGKNYDDVSPKKMGYVAIPGAKEVETCSLDAQNQANFGANMDSSGLLPPTAVSSIGTSSIDADTSSMPLGTSGFQSSLYGYMQESSGLLHSAGQVDQPTRIFVKVYKSGSFGRSLDITRFNSYDKLLEELGQMFGIEGLLDNPKKSGWKLVYVDRENDVLLLGDDPWVEFANNVRCIKILSPKEVW